MSTGQTQTDPLEAARLGLEACKTAADAEAQLLGARAAWNTAMVEAIAKRVQIEKDVALLRGMEAALVSYHRANAELERTRRRLERRAHAVAEAVQHAGWIERGEALDPNNVRFVWIGFRYLLAQSGLGASAPVPPPVPPEALRAENFCHPRDPEDPCGNAPRNCREARALVEWLADLSYMPRVGSAALEALRGVGRSLADAAERRLGAIRTEIAALNADLLAIRQASWKTVNFSALPKEGEPG